MPDSRFQRLRRGTILVIVFALGAWSWQGGLLPGLYDERGDISFLGRQQLVMVAVSALLAIAVGVPLGIALTRARLSRHADAILQVINMGSAIPTLAVLALSLSVIGIGWTPSIFGLFVATLLPIVSNTIAGIRAVPPLLTEAARGMGMSGSRILWQVELPNALFVIYSGIRTGVAINVGTAPLAFLIGGGGLGDLIFQGISLNEFDLMLAGAIPTALMAILIDMMIAALQFWTIPRGVNPLR